MEAELYNALKDLVAITRTFRNVPKEDQDWGPVDDEALDQAFNILEKYEQLDGV